MQQTYPDYYLPLNQASINRSNPLQYPGIIQPKDLEAFIFKPVEVKFGEHLGPIFGPLFKFKLGWHHGKCYLGDQQNAVPSLVSSSYLERKHDEKFAKLKVKDKAQSRLRQTIGEVKIPLDDIVRDGSTRKWYKLEKKGAVVAEVLLEIEYNKKPGQSIPEMTQYDVGARNQTDL